MLPQETLQLSASPLPLEVATPAAPCSRPAPSSLPGRTAGKQAGFSQAPPIPRTSGREHLPVAFCRPASGRPRTHLPPPAAPAPSVSRSPGAVPGAPAPARRALFPRIESGKPVRPICPERRVRPLGVPKGWGTVPRNAFQMGARSKQSPRCGASPHPAGPKVKAQAAGAKGDWRSSRLSQGRLANLPITQSHLSLQHRTPGFPCALLCLWPPDL